MDKKDLQAYAEIKLQLSALEEKRKEIELKLIEAWEGEQKLTTPFGSFALIGRRNWKYSESIKSMQDAILEAKHKEEKDGTAELIKHTQFIVFTNKEQANG